MTKKSLLISTALYATIACVSVTFAQAPVVNIDSHRHGNMAAAQKFIVQAYQKLDAAQRDNDDQLGGHAQRARIFSPRQTLRSGSPQTSPTPRVIARESRDNCGFGEAK
jgi:hypothetical protein